MKTLRLQKKLLSNINILSVVLTTSIMSAAIAADSANINNSFYLGADAIYSRMGFKQNYGNNIFTKSAPGINAFVGYTFNDIVGLEVGYEIEKKQKKKDLTINGVNYIAGWRTPGALRGILNSEVKQRHPYLGVTGKVNINDKCFIAGLLGVSVSHIHARYHLVDAGVGIDETATFSKTKPVAMARLSVGYSITDKVDVRAYTTWRNTSRFKIESQENTPGNLIKLRDNFNVGLGFVYNIV